MSQEKQYKLSKQVRLKKPASFTAVFHNRNSSSDGNILLYGKPNELEFSRFGVSVSKKLGNAVTRNRYKRCLREAFRLSQHDLPGGYDWVIIPRPTKQCVTNKYIKSLLSLAPRVVKKQKRESDRAPK